MSVAVNANNNSNVTSVITPTVNNGSQVLTSSSPSYSLSSAPPSTPYEIHQRLFGYNKRKSKTKSNLPQSGASKKSKKDVAWTHTFVCLPDNDIEHVPGDYSVMTANGLGKAKLRLSEGSTAMDIHDIILAQFPKLKACGGYELLRTAMRIVTSDLYNTALIWLSVQLLPELSA